MSWAEFINHLGHMLVAIGWAFVPVLLLPFIYLFTYNNNFIHQLSSAIILTIDRFNYALGEFMKWALPLLVLTVAFSVFVLSIFGLSWTKLTESTIYMHAGVIMLGSAVTLMAGQHVRVDIFYSQMKPIKRALVDFCGFYALLLPTCLIILWNSESFVHYAWLNLEGSSEADGIPAQFLLKTLIPAFSLTMISQGMAIALRAAMMMRGQVQPDREPGIKPFFQDQELEH